MHDFIEKFLENYKLATDRQRKREFWNVEGIIKGKSNQSFKFDLRPIIKNAKGGSFKTKADKMVFDVKDQYILVDVEELHEYLKNNDTKVVFLNDIYSKLDWNIILVKENICFIQLYVLIIFLKNLI